MSKIDFDPDDLSPQYLGSVSSDFVKVADTLMEASYEIRRQEFSQYPIFPIAQTELAIGKLLVGAGERGMNWNYYVTFLEEFIQRGLIGEDRLEHFQSIYKDPDEHACLFVVEPERMNFVFVPFPEGEGGQATL